VAHYRAALAAFRDLGHAYGQANALSGMAEAHAALGDDAAATQAWTEALELYRAQNREAEAERARQLLESVARAR
jgi:hypothetical protein